MKSIVFSDSPDELFNIMAKDDRFMICSRIYTVAESTKEAKRWDHDKENYLVNIFETEVDNEVDYDDWRHETGQSLVHEQNFSYDNGERPVELDDNSFCYVIVDLVEKIRGADNFYGKFNYLDTDECIEAIGELNTIKIKHNDLYTEYKLQISRRNRIDLMDYKIT